MKNEIKENERLVMTMYSGGDRQKAKVAEETLKELISKKREVPFLYSNLYVIFDEVHLDYDVTILPKDSIQRVTWKVVASGMVHRKDRRE